MVYLITGLIAGGLAHYFYPEHKDYNVWLSGYAMGVAAMIICNVVEEMKNGR